MNSGHPTAVKGGAGTTSTPANSGGNATGSARRESTSGLFTGLMNQKRNSSDAAAQARRESFHDMKPQPGFLGKMWNNFTTGSGTK